MAMVVQHNIAAHMALGELNKNSDGLKKSLAKVSTGQKINSAQDNASGYVISEKMREMIRTLGQDHQNVQNGSALVRIAQDSIDQIIQELRNLKELAINSANDTNTDADRLTIQKVFAQKITNINDIATETNYNGKRLLDGTYARDVLVGSSFKENFEIVGYEMRTITITKPTITKMRQTDGTVAIQENNNNSELAKNFRAVDPGIQRGSTYTGRGIAGDVGFSQYGSTWNWATAMKESNSEATLSGGGAGTSYSPKGVDYSTKQIGVSMNFTFGSDEPTVDDLDGEGFSILCGGCRQYINIVFDARVATENSSLVRPKSDAENSTYRIGISDLSAVDNDSLSEAIFNGVNSILRSDERSGYYYGEPCPNYSEYDVTLNGTVVSTLLDRTHNVRVALNPNYDADDPSRGTRYIFTKEETFAPDMVFVGGGSLVAVDEPKSLPEGTNWKTITVNTQTTMTVNEPIYQYSHKIIDIYEPEGKPLKIHHGPHANQAINIFISNMHTKFLGTEELYIDNATLKESERFINEQDRARYEALGYDRNKQLAWMDTLKLANDKNLDDISVTTQKNSNIAIRVIDGAIEDALNEATQMGSYLQRLEHTDANVVTMGENVQAAESAIRDSDMAKEMTEYTKNNVLLQSAQAMLAQANQNSSAVLSLLQ